MTYPVGIGRKAQSGSLLVMNTAEGVLQIVLAREGSVLWSESLPAASQGAELLTPALARGLETLGAKPKDIRRITCVVGPGSFTGLRLACATAAGLAAAVGALQAGLPLLPLLARSAAKRLGTAAGLFGVITHARRNLVHLQVFRLKSAELEAATEILVLSPEAAARATLAHDSGCTLLGSGLGRNRGAIEAAVAGSEARLLGPEHDHPSPAVLVAEAEAATFGSEPPVPLYVRPSDAEENLPILAKALGLDVGRAISALRGFTAYPPAGGGSV